ncbi:MAG: hypothetical protein JWQ29_2592 [Phenylobacterium sp.]|nr:hypothetical protein [Phenylobacterium sp.]
MTSTATDLGSRSKPNAALLGLLTILLLAAIVFVGKYVFPYYLNYTPEGFHDYWPRRLGLLAHVTAGTVAILLGPFQLWSGFRARFPVAHRWTGRAYLATVTIGCAASFYLAFTTTLGWAFGWGIAGLAIAWAGTSLVGYYAILQRNVALHRRWMIRAYVVTFGFVTFRIIDTTLSAADLGSPKERGDMAAWLCWAGPLLVTLIAEGVLDARRSRSRVAG